MPRNGKNQRKSGKVLLPCSAGSRSRSETLGSLEEMFGGFGLPVLQVLQMCSWREADAFNILFNLAGDGGVPQNAPGKVALQRPNSFKKIVESLHLNDCLLDGSAPVEGQQSCHASPAVSMEGVSSAVQLVSPDDSSIGPGKPFVEVNEAEQSSDDDGRLEQERNLTGCSLNGSSSRGTTRRESEQDDREDAASADNSHTPMLTGFRLAPPAAGSVSEQPVPCANQTNKVFNTDDCLVPDSSCAGAAKSRTGVRASNKQSRLSVNAPEFFPSYTQTKPHETDKVLMERNKAPALVFLTPKLNTVTTSLPPSKSAEFPFRGDVIHCSPFTYPSITRLPSQEKSPEAPTITGNKIQCIKKEPDSVWRVKALLDRGEKVLILLRGCPGSGKSTLASHLKFSGSILSTDEYFQQGNIYNYNQTQASEAHMWNKNRAKDALERGVNPVIIDNTNTQVWEMRPYVLLGNKFGYNVQLIEPETSWKFTPRKLVRKNIHGVTYERIKQMVQRYDHDVTVEKMLKAEVKPTVVKQEPDAEEAQSREKEAKEEQNPGTETAGSITEELRCYGETSCAEPLEGSEDCEIHDSLEDASVEEEQEATFDLSSTDGDDVDQNNSEVYFASKKVVSDDAKVELAHLASTEDSKHQNGNGGGDTKERFCDSKAEGVPAVRHPSVEDVERKKTEEVVYQLGNRGNVLDAIVEQEQHDDAKNRKVAGDVKDSAVGNKDDKNVRLVSMKIRENSCRRDSAESECSDTRFSFSSLHVSVGSISGFNPDSDSGSDFGSDIRSSSDNTSELRSCILSELDDISEKTFLDAAAQSVEEEVGNIGVEPASAANDFSWEDPKQWEHSAVNTVNKSNMDRAHKQKLVEKMYWEVPSLWRCENNCGEAPCERGELGSEDCILWNDPMPQRAQVRNKTRHTSAQSDDTNKQVTPEIVEKESHVHSTDVGREETNENVEGFLDDSTRLFLETNDWKMLPFVFEEHCSSGSTHSPGPVSDKRAFMNVSTMTESSDFAYTDQVNNCQDLKEICCPFRVLTCTGDFKSAEVVVGLLERVPSVVLLDKSCMADITEPLEIQNKLKFLQSCFPDINVSDLQETLHTCFDNVQLAATLFLDWGHSVKLTEDEMARFGSQLLGKSHVPVEDTGLPKTPKSLIDICISKLESFQEFFVEIIQSQIIQNSMDRLKFLEFAFRRKMQTRAGAVAGDSSGAVTPCESGALNGVLVESSHSDKDDTGDAIQWVADTDENGAECNLTSSCSWLDTCITSSDSPELSSDSAPRRSTSRESSPMKTPSLLLQLPLEFAKSLIDMFGPVGSLASVEAIAGHPECLNMNIDLKTARHLHDLWSSSVSSSACSQKVEKDTSSFEAVPLGSLQPTEPSKTKRKKFKHKLKFGKDYEKAKGYPKDQPSLKLIMEEEKQRYQVEMKHLEHLKMLGRDKYMATKMKRLKLHNRFPGVDPSVLDEIFEANKYSLHDTVMAIEGSPPAQFEGELLKLPVKTERDLALEDIANNRFTNWSYRQPSQHRQSSGSIDGCEEEMKLNRLLKQECYQKAMDAHHRGMHMVAQFYSNKGLEHSTKAKDVGHLLAKQIVNQRSHNSDHPLVLDLHGFNVKEALAIVKEELLSCVEKYADSQKERNHVVLITGKGTHSTKGVPKLRPAVIDFLNHNSYSFTEPEVGQIKVLVRRNRGSTLRH